MRKKRIALFGGSFNPPHDGHSAVVKALEGVDGIDEIWLMPSANRWDKSISVSGPDRLRMIDLMIDDKHRNSAKPVRAFDHEIRKPNLSTTFGTKAELEKLYPYHEFHFVFGSDVVPHIAKSWTNGQELFDTASFIFMDRPGCVALKDCDLPKNSTCIPLSETRELSSSQVRRIAHDEATLAKLVSPSVARFIANRKLYT